MMSEPSRVSVSVQERSDLTGVGLPGSLHLQDISESK